jgi:hypothetical protein
VITLITLITYFLAEPPVIIWLVMSELDPELFVISL